MASRVLVRNTCSRSKVDPCFDPLIEAAIDTFQELFADNLIAVHLMGSVARGEATPTESDIDFLAIVRRAAQPPDLEHLATHEGALVETYPVVARVDLEVEPVDGLSEFRQFVLASDSISIFGADSLTRPRQYVEREWLAHLVTPDGLDLIRSYQAAVARLDCANDQDLLARYARVIGKDLLKCLRFVALRRGATYQKNIGAIHRQLVEIAPEYRPLADDLYALYRDPRAGKAAILHILAQAAERLPIS